MGRRHREPGSRSWRVNITVLLMLAMVGFTACGGSTGTTTGTSPGATSSTAPSSTSQTPTPTPASWRRIPVAPIHGYYSTPAGAVWDGKEMLVVATKGGRSGDCKEYVVAYDPTLDSWRTMSRVPAPEGCFEGSDEPVWTGHELLLWGISNAAYDPANDTWRHLPEPPAGAGGPSVVVWTGKQMIGWGGGCCDMQLADGAAYTLATNSWKLLPPSPLLGRHTAGVWTGREMLIAGGYGYTGFRPGGEPISVHFADGAAYDPTTPIVAEASSDAHLEGPRRSRHLRLRGGVGRLRDDPPGWKCDGEQRAARPRSGVRPDPERLALAPADADRTRGLRVGVDR